MFSVKQQILQFLPLKIHITFQAHISLDCLTLFQHHTIISSLYIHNVHFVYNIILFFSLRRLQSRVSEAPPSRYSKQRETPPNRYSPQRETPPNRYSPQRGTPPNRYSPNKNQKDVGRRSHSPYGKYRNATSPAYLHRCL